MCGIVGYVGKNQAQNYVIKSLEKLDYRGYDSAGVCFLENESLVRCRVVGSVQKLKAKLGLQNTASKVMIGHTRWATHGKVSVKNAHPQMNNQKTIAVVHNGIIENFQQLKHMLETSGYVFESQTDTEIIPNLINHFLSGKSINKQNVLVALSKTCKALKGTFALCVLVLGLNQIFVCTRFSPLIVCKFFDGAMVASDLGALPQGACFKLPDNCFGCVDCENTEFFNEELKKISVPSIQRCKNWGQNGLLGFHSFMEKEINESSKSIRKTLNYLKASNALQKLNLKTVKKVYITACGTAFHAGKVLAFLLKQCHIEVEANFASEFRYFPPNLKKGDLCIFISQSGETADTLFCLEFAKLRGAKTLGITNVQTSRMADLVDFSITTMAGPEKAVASTKSYQAQLAVCYALANAFCQAKHKTSLFKFEDVKRQAQIVKNTNPSELNEVVNKLSKLNSLFILGRGLDYVSAQEGALKIKEVGYIHCEAMPLGELKHGSLALFSSKTYCIVLMTNSDLYAKVENTINEIKSRGAHVVLITNSPSPPQTDFLLRVGTSSVFSPFAVAKVLQLMALKISVKKGISVDKPRNLAKSVTVE